jgi:hypothetical protein
MFRRFLCGLIAVVLVAGVGLAADKAKKGKAVNGKFESFADGTLKIKTGKKNDTKVQDFKIAEDIKVVVYTDGEKKEIPAKDAFKDVKSGTTVAVTVGDSDKVTGVTIGAGKKATGTFTSFKDGTLTLKVKNKKGEESKEFKVAADTKAVTLTNDGKKEGTAKDALGGLSEGTPVTIHLGKKDAVVSIEVGTAKKKGNK